MEDEPITASDYYHKGLSYVQSGDFPRALDYINKALAQNYFGADIALIKGEILFELALYDDALEWIKRAIEFDKTLEPEGLLWQGRIFFEKHQLGRALVAFNRTIALMSMPGEAYLGKGMVLCERKDYFSAIASLEKAREFLGDSLEKRVEIAFWQGRNYVGLKRFAEAQAHFEYVLELAPDFSEAYSELGDLLRSQGLVKQACKLYQRAIKLFHQSPSLYNDYGNTLREAGKFRQSLIMLEKALSFHGAEKVTLYNRGLTHEKLKNWDDALADYERVIQDDPEDIEARLRRIDILSQSERFREAFHESGQLAEEDRKSSEARAVHARALNRYARFFEASGRKIQALGIYYQLLELHPDSLDFDSTGQYFSSSRERQKHILEELTSLRRVLDAEENHTQNKPEELLPAHRDCIPLLQAYLLSRLGRVEEVPQHELDPFLKTGPFQAFAYYILADIHYHGSENSEAALETLEYCLEQQEDFIQALWLKVRILDEGLNQPEAAIETLERILHFSPNLPEVLHTLGEFHFEQGNFHQALLTFQQLQADMCGETPLAREIAECFFALGCTEDALEVFHNFSKQGTDAFDLYIFHIDFLLRTGSLQKASKLLKQLEAKLHLQLQMKTHETQDDYLLACRELEAGLFNQQGESTQALECLSSYEDHALSERGRFEKSLALIQENQPQKASSYLSQLVKQLSAYTFLGWQTRVALAKLHRSQNNFHTSLELLKEVLDAHPFLWRIRALYVWILREDKKAEAAETEETKVFFYREMRRGTRFMYSGEFKDAEQVFKAALIQSPDPGLVHYWLAAAYCQLGNFDQALEHMVEALKDSPSWKDEARKSPFFEHFAFSELQSHSKRP